MRKERTFFIMTLVTMILCSTVNVFATTNLPYSGQSYYGEVVETTNFRTCDKMKKNKR